MPLSGTGERVIPVLDFPSRDGLSVQADADAAGRPAADRTIDASKRGLAGPMTGARTERVVLVELDTRQDADDAGQAFRHPFRYAR
jgi:hypothetical protein